jgi:hypothetical protein
MGKADKLINKISECRLELNQIQDSCNHVQKEVKFVNPKEGVRWVCKECRCLIGWPTKLHLDKWSNK